MKFIKKTYGLIANYVHILANKGGDFHKEEDRLLQTYYSAQVSAHKQLLKNGIVMMVDGRTMHGGLSDRLRGICSVYYWCKQHNVPFYIHFDYPFALANYLSPNAVNWGIADEDLCYHKEQAQPILLMLHLLPSKLHKFYLSRILPLAKRKQLHVYSNTLVFDKFYSQSFNELFKLTQPLQTAVNNELSHIKQPFEAMVLRFQQLLGDFKEGDYEILPPPKREILIQKCIMQIDKLHKQTGNNKLILLTSDSITFLNEAAAHLPYVRTIKGKIVHMDYTLNATFDIYLKSFVDMLTLSHADKIYLLKTDNMYKSGFAYRAAAINNTPYEYVEF